MRYPSTRWICKKTFAADLMLSYVPGVYLSAPPALYGILKRPTVDSACLFLKRKIWIGKKNLVNFYTANCIKTFYLSLLVVYFFSYAILPKKLNTFNYKAKTKAKFVSKQSSKQDCPQVARARSNVRSRHRNYDELVGSAD